MIYLLRHGQTEFNVQGRYQGHSDSPLTELGRRQAEAYGLLLARHLTTPEIWASPLPRAAETARLIARALPGARLTAEPRLKEVSLGQWDGLTRAEIAVDWPEARRGHPPRQWMFHAPGGDRLGPLLARLEAVLQDAGRQGNVVLVSHGIVGRLMRGLHGGLPLEQALVLEAPQDVIYRLGPGGEIAELPRIEL